MEEFPRVVRLLPVLLVGSIMHAALLNCIDIFFFDTGHLRTVHMQCDGNQ